MAQISESNSGGKRSLNYELNLVPFIDLLSVCICFLLIAAVWLQVGTLQVKQAFGTEAQSQEKKETFNLDVRLQGERQVQIQLVSGKKRLKAYEVRSETDEDFRVKLEAEFEDWLTALATKNPETPRSQLIAAATIKPHKAASYNSMILVMDSLRRQQIINLAVDPR